MTRPKFPPAPSDSLGASAGRPETTSATPFPLAADVVGRPLRFYPPYERTRAGQRSGQVSLRPRPEGRRTVNMKLGRFFYRLADWLTFATIVVGGLTLAVGMAFWGLI